MGNTGINANREPWNKGKIVGQKAPFKLKDTHELRLGPWQSAINATARI